MLFCSLFTSSNVRSHVNPLPGYLILCDTQKNADLIKPFREIKSKEFDVRIIVWSKETEKTADNVRTFLRKQKIGEAKGVSPDFPNLKFVMLIGEFPVGEMLRNFDMTPAYFKKNITETDLFYCFLKQEKLDFDGAKVKNFWNTERDIYVGRVLNLNDIVVNNLVLSQKQIICNPNMFFGAPQWTFPWKETQTKSGSGSDSSIATEMIVKGLHDQGFNQIRSAYVKNGSQQSPFEPDANYSHAAFQEYFYESMFSVMLASIYRKDAEPYGTALWSSTVWTDLNGDSVFSKENNIQNNELQTETIASVDELEATPNVIGRALVSLFNGKFTLSADSVFLNEKWVSMAMNHGTYFCSSASDPKDGWQPAMVFLLLKQIFDGKSMAEAVFDIPSEYAKLIDVDNRGLAPFEAWTAASLVVLGDPSYRLMDHLKPYSLLVPSVIDLNLSNQVGLKVTNLSDKEVKVNLSTDSNWIQITEPTISLKPKEEKTISVGRKANWTDFLQKKSNDQNKPCRLPQRLTGIVNINAEGEKSQVVAVKGLT